MNWTLAFVAFAALIVLHEFGHFAAAKAVGIQVTRFSLFFPPTLLKKQIGETSYEIGAIPLGGYVKITGMNPEEKIGVSLLDRAYYTQPVWKRIFVISAGPAMNFLIAFILIFILFSMVGVTSQEPTNKIESVNADGPVAGLIEPGDRWIALNGKSGTTEELVDELSRSKCAGPPVAGCTAVKPISVTVERDGSTDTYVTAPKYDANNKRMRLGIDFETVESTEKLGAVPALKRTGEVIWEITTLTVEIPSRLLDPEKREEISSAAGGYEATAKAIDTGLERTIQIVALISLSLAIINLFPFLPLDGGHIFWALAEKVRGKPIPVRVLERASIVGLALVLMLFFIGLSNDIERFTSGSGFQP